MNARQKAKKCKKDLLKSKIDLEVMESRYEAKCTELHEVEHERDAILWNLEHNRQYREYIVSRIMHPIEYNAIDEDALKAYIASDFCDVIKDYISLKVEPMKFGYKAEARLRIWQP